MSDRPPIPRYRLTLTVDGNTFEEIEDELRVFTNSGLDQDARFFDGLRHEWDIHGPRARSQMEHRNPDMTPERYDRELCEWFKRRKDAR